MLIRYFFILIFPIAMILCVNQFSKDYIKGIKKIPIAGVLLNLLGIAGIVFAFAFKEWSTRNLIIYELIYGLPSIAATWLYAYFIDKKNKAIVQADKERHCKQTIDIEKTASHITLSDESKYDYCYWFNRHNNAGKTVVILPESESGVDLNGNVGDDLSVFAAQELAEEFALNGIASVRYVCKNDSAISVEQHIDAIREMLSQENIGGKIILLSHGHNIGTLLRIYKQIDSDGVIATCPSIVFTNKHALDDFKRMVSEKKTLFVSINKDPLVNCKQVDSIEGIESDNLTYMSYKDVHYTLRENKGIGRWVRKPVQAIDESLKLSKGVAQDMINWIRML